MLASPVRSFRCANNARSQRANRLDDILAIARVVTRIDVCTENQRVELVESAKDLRQRPTWRQARSSQSTIASPTSLARSSAWRVRSQTAVSGLVVFSPQKIRRNGLPRAFASAMSVSKIPFLSGSASIEAPRVALSRLNPELGALFAHHRKILFLIFPVLDPIFNSLDTQPLRNGRQIHHRRLSGF